MKRKEASISARASRSERLAKLGARLPPDCLLASHESRESAEANTISTDYPRLYLLLRDSGLPFKPLFAVEDVASLVGKSSRTIREWTQKGLIPYSEWPLGGIHYTPTNLEEFLARCQQKEGD